MKLAVCTIWSSPFMFTDFVDSMLSLDRPDDVSVKFIRGIGWCPAARHNNACHKALLWGADLILILGGDQLYPHDLLPRLVNRFNQGYEVVAAMVPCRGYVSWQPMKPFQPMAWRFTKNGKNDSRLREYRGMHLDGDMVHVIQREDGEMQEIDFIGSGVLMFHRDHLLALGQPWFKESIEPDGTGSLFKRVANQDCVFVWRLQVEAHAQCWVDTTIEIRHLHIFAIDDTFSDRFADWAVDATTLYGVGSKDRPKVAAPQHAIQ